MDRFADFNIHKFYSGAQDEPDLLEDNSLNSREFMDVQSVIDDDLSEKAANEFAESYGLVAKIIDGQWPDLCNQSYPSIVKTKDGRFFLVIRANEYGILLYDQQSTKSSIVTKDLFMARWTGQAVTFFDNK